jgi:hypothetical protein
MGNGNVIVNKSYIMQIKLAATTNSTVARLSTIYPVWWSRWRVECWGMTPFAWLWTLIVCIPKQREVKRILKPMFMYFFAKWYKSRFLFLYKNFDKNQVIGMQLKSYILIPQGKSGSHPSTLYEYVGGPKISFSSNWCYSSKRNEMKNVLRRFINVEKSWFIYISCTSSLPHTHTSIGCEIKIIYI